MKVKFHLLLYTQVVSLPEGLSKADGLFLVRWRSSALFGIHSSILFRMLTNLFKVFLFFNPAELALGLLVSSELLGIAESAVCAGLLWLGEQAPRVEI